MNPDLHLHLWGFVLVVFIANGITDAIKRGVRRRAKGGGSNVQLDVNWPKGKIPSDEEFRTIRDVLGDAFMAQVKQERHDH